MQLTRTSRALKCWMSLRYFGVDAFRAAIDRALDLAELAAARVEGSDALELMAPPSLGIVCFRRRFPGEPDAVDARNARLVAALEDSGLALVSSTRLDGRYAIRLCVLNHTTAAKDVEDTLDFLETAEISAGPAPAPESHERERDVSSSWVFAELAGDPDVALLPLFHGLTPEELERVRARAEEKTVEAGEALVAQWELSKEFFVLVAREGEPGSRFFVVADGELDVVCGETRVPSLGRCDGFGEIALLDDCPRTPTVTARTKGLLYALERDDFLTAVAGNTQAAGEARRLADERLARAAPPLVAGHEGSALP